MKLVFATNNHHKLDEVRAALGRHFEIISLEQLGCAEDVPENQDTLEGNAKEKAEYIYRKYGLDCFADDTGLEVEALNGRPGVYSARYAGEAKDPNANIKLLLKEMDATPNRKAKFRTVIALIIGGNEYLFQGEVHGQILEERQGIGGFGYDPIFQADGYDVSFAQMSMDQKNEISHRGRAVEKLADFLKGRKMAEFKQK